MLVLANHYYFGGILCARHSQRPNSKTARIKLFVMMVVATTMVCHDLPRAVGFAFLSSRGSLKRALWSSTSRLASSSSCFCRKRMILPGNNRQFNTKSDRFSYKKYFSDSSSTAIFMSATEDTEEMTIDDNGTENFVDIDRIWNLGGLRKEISRLTVRCHKKVGKTNQRLQTAQKEVDRLTSNDDVTLEELEACPNLNEIETEINELQRRLKQLNQLEVLLQDVKGKNVVLPGHIAQLAIELDVNDHPPKKEDRGPKKQKGPRTMSSFRLPYRRYYTKNNTEIRVGKQAQDNDELSLSPEHRESLDWWMHASGCPGSHVVIRCHDQNLDEEIVQDAAALAARQSKCTGNVIKVSMTRARDIQKPPGAKPGLVQLTGQVRTITVNMKEARSRLDRLDRTVLIN